MFEKDENHPLLKNHSLKGNLSGYKAFSITGDIRVIYKKEKNKIILYDIGAHNQVYK
jgi:addiction module RelE/StbE family toxin